MDLSTLLSSLFSVGSAAAGSQDGGSTGGILSSLGSIFGEASPQGNRPGLATALSGLGQLAGSFRATPNEGATEEDIKKANRYNMLAGILGGIGTIAGGELGRRYQDEGKSELAKILGGAGTTTGQEIPTSQKLAKWIEQYPTLASDETLKLQLGMQEKEADRTLKQLELAQKLGGKPISYLDALTIAEKEGAPVELRPQAAQGIQQEQMQNRVAAMQPYQKELATLGIALPAQPQAAPMETKTTSEAAGILKGPEQTKMSSIIAPVGEDQYAEAERLLKQPVGRPPIDTSREGIRSEVARRAERQQQLTEEGQWQDQLGKLQSTEAYKETITGLRKQNQVLSKLTSFTEEIAKRPKGDIKPQDRLQLAKLAVQAIEPGLSVNEGEAQAALKSDSAWWNSTLGKTVANVFGRNEIPVDDLETLLKTTGAYAQAKQNDAKAYLNDEVIPLYQDTVYGEKIIGAINRAIPKTDPLEGVQSVLDKLKSAQGLRSVGRGYLQSPTPTPSVSSSASQALSGAASPQSISRGNQVIGYVRGRPVVGIVKR